MPSYRWPRTIFRCIGGFVLKLLKGNQVTVETPAVLDMTELLTRVDHDRELVSELFFIFRSVVPTHLKRLSDAVAGDLPRQVQIESHTLRGMLLNLSAGRAAALADDLENLGREGKLAGAREALAAFQSEVEILLLHMEASEFPQ